MGAALSAVGYGPDLSTYENDDHDADGSDDIPIESALAKLATSPRYKVLPFTSIHYTFYSFSLQINTVFTLYLVSTGEDSHDTSNVQKPLKSYGDC